MYFDPQIPNLMKTSAFRARFGQSFLFCVCTVLFLVAAWPALFGSEAFRSRGGQLVERSDGLTFETGVLAQVNEAWLTVTLENTYISPIVVATVNYPTSTSQPVVARIRNAAGNRFELRVQNPSGDYLREGYTVYYIVAEEGVYTEEDHGIKMEAARIPTTGTSHGGSWSTELQTMQNSYDSPVVLGQVMTEQDERWSVFWASSGQRENAPERDSIGIGKHAGEDTNPERAIEEIGFLVLDTGQHELNGVLLEARVGPLSVESTVNSDSGYIYTYNDTLLPDAGMVALSSAGMKGNDGSWPVLVGASPVGNGTITLALDEDQVGDAERIHRTEEVAFVVFNSPSAYSPVAAFTSDPGFGQAPLTVVFDASGSTDPDGEITEYAWDFGVDGAGPGTGVSPSFTYEAPGEYTVSLTVTDNAGRKTSISHPVSVRAEPPAALQAETGLLPSVGGEWQVVELANTYISPVVVATVNYPASTSLPVVARIRNAAADRFELRIQNPSGEGLVDNYAVHFVVVEEGSYTQALHGIKMDAVRLSSSQTSYFGSWASDLQSLQNNYDSPVVVGQVMSAQDEAWSVFWASDGGQESPPESNRIGVGKHVAQDTLVDRAEEELGFLVFEAGVHRLDGILLQAGVGPEWVRGTQDNAAGYSYVYNKFALPDPEVVVLSSAGMLGDDGGWPVLLGPSPLGNGEFTLAIDEDQIADAERIHRSERVAFVVFDAGILNSVDGEGGAALVGNRARLLPNYPNPVSEETTIEFFLPEAGVAILAFHHMDGRLLGRLKGNYPAGYSQVRINRNDLPASGLVFYELLYRGQRSTRRMVLR